MCVKKVVMIFILFLRRYTLSFTFIKGHINYSLVLFMTTEVLNTNLFSMLLNHIEPSDKRSGLISCKEDVFSFELTIDCVLIVSVVISHKTTTNDFSRPRSTVLLSYVCPHHSSQILHIHPNCLGHCLSLK